jgi:transposase
MPRLRFVRAVSEEEKVALQEMYASHASFRTRQRAHAILLSSKEYTIPQLQEVFGVDRDTISNWINRFETKGVVGLEEGQRSGRPTIYTDEEINQFKVLIDNEPSQIKKAKADFEQITDKSSCIETLKRALKKN